MAKQPAPGRTKTRLVPPLTADAAAALYRCFLLDVLDRVRRAAGQVAGLTPGIAFAPPSAQKFFRQLAGDFLLIPQQGKRLGDRLQFVLSAALAGGHAQAVAINSDSPTLPLAHLVTAFQRLDDPEIDCVFGPCEDGGYYLIGVKRPPGRVVTDVQMSTPRVLQDTLAIAEQEGWRVALLPRWYDVDGAAELARLRAELAQRPTDAPHTSRFLAENPL